MTDQLEQLVRNACFAADVKVIDAYGATLATKTRIAIRTALATLEANGMIKFVPMNDWPELFDPDKENQPNDG